MIQDVVAQIRDLIEQNVVLPARHYQMPKGCVINKQHKRYLTLSEQRDQTKVIIQNIAKDAKKSTIIDLTASVGGDTIGLCQLFRQVIAVELDSVSYLCLVYNIIITLKYKNVVLYNKNSTEAYKQLIKLHKPQYVFIDPPWGFDYKEKDIVTLQLNESNIQLQRLIKYILSKRIQIFMKVPLNYDYKQLESFQSTKHIIYRNSKPLYYLIHIM